MLKSVSPAQGINKLRLAALPPEQMVRPSVNMPMAMSGQAVHIVKIVIQTETPLQDRLEALRLTSEAVALALRWHNRISWVASRRELQLHLLRKRS